MGRILTMLAATAVTMILIVGGGLYGLSSGKTAKIREDSATAVANAAALTLSQQISLLNRTLNKMAQDPEVVVAVTTANPVLLSNEAARLEKYFPDALKIRLLLPGVNDLDENSTPRMGFADLDMVRETFANEQPPGIQGYEGTDRHLALTARVMQNDRVVGVLLASLNYDFFSKSLQAAAVKNGVIELRQGDLVLGRSGQRNNDGNDPYIQTRVVGTSWDIYHYYAVGSDLADLSLNTTLIIVPALLMLLAVFFTYRRLSDFLAQDLETVLNVSKDMMILKSPSSYPVNFKEVTAIITAMMRFKRALDQANTEASVRNKGELDLSFDQVTHYEFNNPNVEEHQFSNLTATSPAEILAEARALLDNGQTDAPDNRPMDMLPATTPAYGSTGIYRPCDIGGIVGETFSVEDVHNIGRAFGTAAKKQGCKVVAMGRDGRLSSPALADALAQGILSTGLNVLNIGKVPTPMLYFVAQHTECRTGIMITGSHNPPDYNGLKLILNGDMLMGDKIQQLQQCIADQDYTIADAGRVENNDGYTHEYIGTIADDIHIARPMLVVLDCGNGVGGELGPHLLQALGCEVVELFCEVDGSFPNHSPDPSKADNLAELIASVKHYKADLGIAFDGDGDRLGVVDSNGYIISPDRLMMLFAKEVLGNRPGAEIIYDVKCTRHLAEQITKYGGRPTMWKTGSAFMRAKIKETGAALAGEMSGHIFFNERWFGFADALYAAARLIEIMSKDVRS
ncbi:MAG: phosphomannomutase/phosphoglucomutase, partial [Methylococcaceae bacterium]|nr:phosphomannomutase/phosphoglucomutase [Methylococcaceae bacterium]